MSLFRTKYAGELAVLSTWLCAALPWSVSFLRAEELQTDVIWLRFLPLRFQYVLGPVGGDDPLKFVWGVPDYVVPEVRIAAYAWILGLVVFLAAFLLSLIYYLREDLERQLPVDPVTLLGALLVGTGVILGGSTVLYQVNQSGTTVPVGVLFQLVLGVVLLRLERA